MPMYVLSVCLSLAVVGAPIQKDERDYQNQAYNQWWGGDLERRLAALPTVGKVPDFRIPYSGYDYPDRGGGTDVRFGRGPSALGKYDIAFHNGRGLAVAHERLDVTANRDNGRSAPGLFGGRLARLEQIDRPLGLFERLRARRTVGWYGHCNGRTAASIRHAEPQRSVVRNGVTFTPSDIKALLAEVYMYSDTEFLGGVDQVINPGTLHLTLANWLGRGDYPVGMETVPGKTVFNYPIYAYKATVTKQSDRAAEVKMTVTYAMSSNSEMEKSPRLAQTMYFHYVLDLNEKGEIIGGRYYGDSEQIDMLWAPLKPAQGGEKGNEAGNPYLDVKEVLSIWRDSVPKDVRKKWLNIDPIDPKPEAEPTKPQEEVANKE